MPHCPPVPLAGLVALFALCALAPARATAQDVAEGAAPAPDASHPTRVLRAVRITGAAPAIDGRLDDPAWQSSPATTTPFVQQRPAPGVPATQRTEARVLYDDRAIYVAMRMWDTRPNAVAATVARRDYNGYSDWAQVIIDSYHGRRTAFRFGVNPAGVQKDVLQYSDGGGEDAGWDAVWQSAARVDSSGWTAEFRIPLSQLRFSTARRDSTGALVWGIEFLRDIARLNERDYWAPIPPGAPGFVSRFGDLTGLSGLAAPRRLELRPYVSGSVTRAPDAPGDPFYQRTDGRAKLGGDARYGVTSDLTLSAALNPDFGQVEADPSVVNLTAFETFFEEKRPFFQEGSEIFRFDIGFPYEARGDGFGNDQPFYSRRIGRSPQGEVPGEATFADVPEATTILGAAKLSGRTSRGWSVGVLDAVTAREEARFTAGADDPRFDAVVEPLTNYGVARVTRDFRAGQSALGSIFTATNRSLAGTGLAGTGLAGALRSAAYTGGLDGRHRFGGGAYEITGSALGSLLQGSARAIAELQTAPGHYFQRPDATYLALDTTRTSLAGYATSAAIQKIGGSDWRWRVAGNARSPGFDMGDVGYQRSADWLLAGASLSHVNFRPGRVLREWQVGVDGSAGWSYGGERRAAGVSMNGNATFLSNWQVNASLERQLPALSIDELRGGPALRVPAYSALFLAVESDTRKALSGELRATARRESESEGRDLEVSGELEQRVGGRAQFSLEPEVSWAVNPWQYITTQQALGAPQYLYGRIRRTTLSLTARADYAFTPNLSFQLYAQPFIAAGGYSRFRRVASPRAARFDERFEIFAPGDVTYDAATARYAVDLDGDGTGDVSFRNPDFNVRELRSTAVLRWQYLPGSTLYVVWNQGRSQFAPVGSFALGRDASALFRAPATNVLLVKLDYWFGI